MKIENLAETFGVSSRTIDNYIKDLKTQTATGFIPASGRHNILRAMALYYYLTEYPAYKDEGIEVSEYNNNLDLLLSRYPEDEILQEVEKFAGLILENKRGFLLKKG